MPTQKQLVSGLGGAIGSDFRSAQNQLLFVEYSGKLSLLNLTRTATVVSSGTKVLLSSYGFDLDTGTEGVHGGPVIGDIQWLSVLPEGMYPNFSAQLIGLGVTNFAAITADTLQSLTYSTAFIPRADFVNGYVFAVLTNGGNYAKVQVVPQGLNLQIEWVTYKLLPAYEVLGTGYTEPEDVKASSDGVHAYVTERSGDLVKVALPTANRSAATTTVIVSGMNAPQQMFLDEVHQTAYVVEYASPGALWKVNLAAKTKTAILTGLQNPVGVVISADLQYAYISEQTTGPDLGRVSEFQLSSGTRTPIVKGLTKPSFLTWFDAAQTSLLVPQLDPADSILLINVAAGTYQTVVTGTPSQPSSVAQTGTGQILICTNSSIVETSLTTSMSTSGPLLMGIGFVPFDKIGPLTIPPTPVGYANTTVDPTYFYQVNRVPFAGTLPLMINYMAALNIGAAYYRVTTTSPASATPVAQNITWTDEHWNGIEFVADTTSPTVVGGLSDCYPVRALADLFNWMNPSLGGFLVSTGLPEGLNTITVTFVNAAGGVVGTATPLTIYVDNNPCTATIGQPILHGVPADTVCGLLHYGIKDSSPVSIAFTASQLNNNATFSFDVIKGVAEIDSIGGPVNTAAADSPFTEGVATLLGTCTIAGYAAQIYVAASAINGWGRQSEYDASGVIAFVLAP
jgi:hypothetical protein